MNKSALRYFWTGILAFWVPLILFVYSIKLVWPVVGKLSKPIARLLPFHSVAGEIVDFIIGLLIIILVTFLVGWIAQKTILKRWALQIDKLLARLFPNYSFYKNFVSDPGVDEQKKWRSVIIKEEEDSKLGFIVDEQDGLCTVYIPGVPNPYEGEVVFKKQDNLHLINISFIQAVEIIRRYGIGFSVVKNLEKT